MSVIAQAGAKGRQLHKFGGSSLADAKCYLPRRGDHEGVFAGGGYDGRLRRWQHHQPADQLA